MVSKWGSQAREGAKEAFIGEKRKTLYVKRHKRERKQQDERG